MRGLWWIDSLAGECCRPRQGKPLPLGMTLAVTIQPNEVVLYAEELRSLKSRIDFILNCAERKMCQPCNDSLKHIAERIDRIIAKHRPLAAHEDTSR